MTQYEIFLKQQGGYHHVGTRQAGSARAAWQAMIDAAEQAQIDAGGPPDTSGQYLIVPTTNATIIDRQLVEEYRTTERKFEPDPAPDSRKVEGATA